MADEDNQQDPPNAEGELIPADELESLVDQRVEERLAELGVDETDDGSGIGISRRSVIAALGSGAAGFGLANVASGSSRGEPQALDESGVAADFEVADLSAQTINADVLNAGVANIREFDGVRYASEFDGANGGEMIQNAIDDANRSFGPNVVMVGPEGPDNPDSSSTNSDWLLEKAIELYDDTTVILVNAKLFLAAGAMDNIIRNKSATSGTSDRNSQVHIIGYGQTYLDANPENQGFSSQSEFSPAIKLYKVDGGSVGGVKARSYGPPIVPEDVNDFNIHNIYLNQRTSTTRGGIHLQAPLANVTVHTIRGYVADDGIIVNSGEGNWSFNQAKGQVKGVTATNVSLEQLDTGSLFRCDPDYVTNSYSIENVSFTNSTGRGFDWLVRLGAARGTSMQRLREIQASSVSGDGKGLALQDDVMQVSVNGIQCSNTIFTNSGYSIDGLTIHDAKSTPEETTYGFLFEKGGTVSNTSARDLQISGPAAADKPGFSIDSDVTVSDLVVDGLYVNKFSKGVEIESGATIQNIRFSNWSFENIATSEWSLGETLGVTRNGIGTEQADAESPTLTEWSIGDIVEFSDTGDGSATGVYLRSKGGWKQLI